MHLLGTLSPRRVFGGLAVLLVGLTFACTPASAPASTPAGGDPFAVVRATSQAAFQTGKAHLDRGEFLPACVDLDTARTNDPDSRSDIQQALSDALAHCLTPVPEPTQSQRSIGVATLALAAPLAAATPGPPATVVPTRGAVSKPSAATPTTVAAAPQTGATEQAAGSHLLVAWRDSQGRFSISAPADWATEPQPLPLFGTGVVQFRDPTGHAELDVAVDNTSKAVSPELYAATMDIAMQQQVLGYAGEQVVPGNTAGQPSVRRVFTFTQRDAAGHDLQARSFQVTILKGSTPYIISGSAPADQFQQYVPTFDQMVETFRFS